MSCVGVFARAFCDCDEYTVQILCSYSIVDEDPILLGYAIMIPIYMVLYSIRMNFQDIQIFR